MMVAGVTAALACLGVAEGWSCRGWSPRSPGGWSTPLTDVPAVTVLKPLLGDEPLLEEALATLCRQAYPVWQIVFGVRDQPDPAVRVVGSAGAISRTGHRPGGRTRAARPQPEDRQPDQHAAGGSL